MTLLTLAFCYQAFLAAAQDNAYRDLLRVSETKVRPTYVLDRTEALQDLMGLERIVREGYSGFEVLRSEGWDWEPKFESLAAAIAEKQDWRQEDLVALIQSRLAGIPDLHFGLIHQGEWIPLRRPGRVFFTGIKVRKQGDQPLRIVEAPTSSSQSLGSILVGVDGEASRDLLFETLPGEPGVQDYYLGKWSVDLDPPPARIETRSKTGEELEWDQELHPPKVRLGRTSARPYRLTYIPFPRIELRTFSALAGPQLEGFLESAEKAKDQAAVVIDLRGNSGGSDRYGTEWLQRLFGAPTSGWEVLELVSPVTLQGDVLLHQWLLSRAASPSEKEQVGGRLASALKNLEEAEAVGLEPEWKKLSVEGGSAPRTSASQFQGRLILLVDSNTSSSAETFVLMAKQFPETVVLGENTHGMMRFGEVKLYRLPNSGIWIQAGSKHFRDPTGEFQEGRGFLPDYWIEDSEPISEIVTGVVSAVAGD